MARCTDPNEFEEIVTACMPGNAPNRTGTDTEIKTRGFAPAAYATVLAAQTATHVASMTTVAAIASGPNMATGMVASLAGIQAQGVMMYLMDDPVTRAQAGMMSPMLFPGIPTLDPLGGVPDAPQSEPSGSRRLLAEGSREMKLFGAEKLSCPSSMLFMLEMVVLAIIGVAMYILFNRDKMRGKPRLPSKLPLNERAYHVADDMEAVDRILQGMGLIGPLGNLIPCSWHLESLRPIDSQLGVVKLSVVPPQVMPSGHIKHGPNQVQRDMIEVILARQGCVKCTPVYDRGDSKPAQALSSAPGVGVGTGTGAYSKRDGGQEQHASNRSRKKKRKKKKQQDEQPEFLSRFGDSTRGPGAMEKHGIVNGKQGMVHAPKANEEYKRDDTKVTEKKQAIADFVRFVDSFADDVGADGEGDLDAIAQMQNVLAAGTPPDMRRVFILDCYFMLSNVSYSGLSMLICYSITHKDVGITQHLAFFGFVVVCVGFPLLSLFALLKYGARMMKDVSDRAHGPRWSMWYDRGKSGQWYFYNVQM